MKMAKRNKRQQPTLWIETAQGCFGPAHTFYSQLNKPLDKHGFEAFVEDA